MLNGVADLWTREGFKIRVKFFWRGMAKRDQTLIRMAGKYGIKNKRFWKKTIQVRKYILQKGIGKKKVPR